MSSVHRCYELSRPVIIALGLIGSLAAACAQSVHTLPAELVYRDWLNPPFLHATINRGGPVREMPESTAEQKAAVRSMLREAQRIVDQNAVLGLLLLDRNGGILFEAYGHGATPASRMMGYSMSKSLTSVATGQALCDDLLPGLETPAQNVAPLLDGTAYGRATIRELLMMASAGKKPATAGQEVVGLFRSLFRTKVRALRDGFREFGSGGDDASTVGRFEYKIFDTYALGFVVSAAAKEPFTSYFAKAVWQKTGAESDAAWLLDRNGDAATGEGFGATLRDWGRAALYVRDQLASGESTCMGRYLKQATTKQIPNQSRRVGKIYNGYGYQFWTDNWMSTSGAFWMSGYGGQRIAIDPASGNVLVLLSYVENFMPEVYRLFGRLNR